MTTVDLHGKTWAEALGDFISFYNASVPDRASSAPTLEVVHGYGSTGSGGVLRTRLRSFLGKYPECLEFTPGEEIDDNPGHTFVTPKTRLPGTGGLLAEQVWEYCENPRTVTKITGRFRRHGDPEVQKAIRTLEKQRRLTPVFKGKFKEYQAT